MPAAISAAFLRCCPIRSSSSRSFGSPIARFGRSDLPVVRAHRRLRRAVVAFADKRAPDLCEVDASAPPSWWDAASWVMLAAVPSALLVAVTAHISTDVASVPLLWVLPLALYLLTFVIVFQRRPIIPHWLVVEVQPLFIIALMAVIIFNPEPVKNIVALIAVHLAVFFVCALVCHGERRRDARRRKTSPRSICGCRRVASSGGSRQD